MLFILQPNMHIVSPVVCLMFPYLPMPSPAADVDYHDSDDEDGHRRGGRSNMNWLTRSDINGLPKATNPLVDETIKKATRDTPEVTQVSGHNFGPGCCEALTPAEHAGSGGAMSKDNPMDNPITSRGGMGCQSLAQP
jgi:hypothetical protein